MLSVDEKIHTNIFLVVVVTGVHEFPGTSYCSAVGRGSKFRDNIARLSPSSSKHGRIDSTQCGGLLDLEYIHKRRVE